MWTLSSRGSIRIRTRDFRGEEEVDSYGAHVSFCVIRKEEEKKKRTLVKNTKKMAESFQKKKTKQKNLTKKEPVGFLFFVR
jgi:hypothetical protein